ncbi:MAG TPA: TusE/DsrC/DsvC family sulfur relay protein [Cellvibrionaceae bacterium]
MSHSSETFAVDKDGYLQNPAQWSESVAEQLAAAEGISLSPAHWEIIFLLRQFYQQFDLAPAMRPLVSYTRKQLGSQKGQSIYLLQLFPPNAALIGSKIAGLPRPANCF